MLNGVLHGPPLTGRLKFGADRIGDSIDAVFMIPLNHPDDPACVWISYSIASLSLPRGSFAITENDHPVCVLLSPEQYEVMIEMLSDTFLLEEAESRMAVNDDAKDISQEEIMRTLGIRQEELDTIDVEICE